MTEDAWIDPDDAPKLTSEMLARAEIRDGDKIIRPATGTVTRNFTHEELEARKKAS